MATQTPSLLLPSDRFLAKAAIIVPDKDTYEPKMTVSYQQLHGLINAAYEQLKSRVSPGDFIAIVVPNSIEYAVTFYALSRLRVVIFPMNPDYSTKEVVSYLTDLKPKAILVTSPSAAVQQALTQLAATPVIQLALAGSGTQVQLDLRVDSRLTEHSVSSQAAQPSDMVLLLHTSGTTGKPKGIPLTHRNVIASAKNIVDTYSLCSGDISLLIMPLFHGHGLVGCLLATLASGGTVICPPKFSAQAALPLLAKYRCTWYTAVPTMHQLVLARIKKGQDVEAVQTVKQTLRFIRSCSSALAGPVWTELEEKLGVPVVQAFGMSEASHQALANPLPPQKRIIDSVGTSGTNVHAAIVRMDFAAQAASSQSIWCKPNQVGELVIRGENVIQSYYELAPEENEANFLTVTEGQKTEDKVCNGRSMVGRWLRSGDLGYMDAEGYVFLIGRVKEMINRGGEKISPLEIDAVLLQHPDVAEAVAFGAPHELYGQDVQAAVVLKDKRDGNGQDEENIIAFCRKSLSSFKCPKRLYFLKELPRTAVGKIQRRNVAAFCLEKFSQVKTETAPLKSKL
eukprot:GILK01007695.1.p1 GENE.GILK01007695.1~~GILK01007695.1.p1  ORF type:complete len:583 (-),score=115.75 GILK01007695.1:581-2281(-)